MDLREEVEHALALGQDGKARRLAHTFASGCLPSLGRKHPELRAWFGILMRLGLAGLPALAPNQIWLWPELAEVGGARQGKTSGPDARGRQPDPSASFITQDPKMHTVLQRIRQLAPTELPVLLEGESGTGKEVLAQAVHRLSRRDGQASVAINCGAMPPQLQESELFGHARGAYTGATMEKQGLFEAAHEGTLFLDEVGEMDARAQVKLLRVLETGELRRLGEVRTRQVNVRIVAATNADLDRATDEGRFRPDLLFRLGAIRLYLTPLRERISDVLPLADYFAHQALGLAPGFSPAASASLVRHSWPGNVRELKYTILRAVAIWKLHRTPSIETDMLFPQGLRSHRESGYRVPRQPEPARPRQGSPSREDGGVPV